MGRHHFGLLAGLAFVLFSVTSVRAQTIFFDESGTFAGGSFGTLAHGFGTDPLATGGPTFPTATLFYVLPFPVTTGDVQLTEPPTGVSDMARFEGNTVYFYSDNLDGMEQLSDVGLPLLLTPTPVVLAESGMEGGMQQAIYTPAPGGPGFNAMFPALQYNIISELPEPAASLIALLGAGMLLFRRKRESGGYPRRGGTE